ncbi:glycosyl hydrolase [Tritrichomonas foetus]|uniref:Glycosyl hydrolase n=1 Tax=Tritrichomonas foetus TaxID=1144522 RepID=A0A1J4JW51_9EUKA|nr:glycosyl hydrolase [Tritrichomonas foetus]|eukprot:OHT01517.1 glycosyl hydrolase [Tritrichomonas foetus]
MILAYYIYIFITYYIYISLFRPRVFKNLVTFKIIICQHFCQQPKMGFFKFLFIVILILVARYYLLQYLRPKFPKFPPRNVPDANPVFPKTFKYGVSTASYQIEADVPPTNWTLWERQTDRFGNPRAPINNRKCDGFNRFYQDIMLAQQLGCKYYRLSFSWARLNPRPGQFDNDILSTYRGWLIKIRELGMEPLLVLWHFEHPAWLEERGSVMSPEFVHKFTEYVEFVVNGVSDVCTFYHTVNEPIGFIVTSIIGDVFPPGKGTIENCVDGIANLMQCHANAYHIIHRLNPNAKVSYAKNVVPFIPMHGWSAIEYLISHVLNFYNRVGFDVFKTGKIQFLWYTREIQNIIGTLDYISLNHYYCTFVTIDYRQWGKLNGNFIPFLSYGDMFCPTSDFGWGMIPGSLSAVARWIHDEYNADQRLPIMITEHGAADSEDTRRQWFLKESLFHLSSLTNLGYPIAAYIHWTLFDNYEWAQGTKMKFGLFQTDYETMERKPRKSAEIFAKIAQLHNNRPDF